MGSLLQFAGLLACIVVPCVAEARKWRYSHDWCFAGGIIFGLIVSSV